MKQHSTESLKLSPPNRPMLTASDLETLLKIDAKTIYTYVQKGLVSYVRLQSNLRFIPKEIQDWIDQQSFQPYATYRERLRGKTETK